VSVSSDPIPRLHVLLSETELDDSGLEWAGEILETGSSIAVHIRARAGGRRLFHVASTLTRRAADTGNWCVVNDRVDVAMATPTQAVQLGRASLPVEDVVRLRGPRRGLRIGVSVHGVEEAVAAAASGADYLVLGTIYSTSSHAGRPGSGPEMIATVGSAVDDESMPVLAIGGIERERVAAVIAAGAWGVVVGRAVCAAPDPVRATQDLEEALRREIGR